MVVIASGTKDQNKNTCKKNHNYGLQNTEYEQMSKDQVASMTRICTSKTQVVSKTRVYMYTYVQMVSKK